MPLLRLMKTNDVSETFGEDAAPHRHAHYYVMKHHQAKLAACGGRTRANNSRT